MNTTAFEAIYTSRYRMEEVDRREVWRHEEARRPDRRPRRRWRRAIADRVSKVVEKTATATAFGDL